MKYTALFEEQVALTPKDMCQEIESIDTLLAEKLQQKLEGKCSRHGFVVSGTLKVLSRSMGAMERGRFTGSILYYIQAEAEVLNPPEGAYLEGLVIRKNRMGMYVSYSVNNGENEAIRVIVPRDLHIGDENFEKVEIGETVKVEIKKSRFQINDPYILSVGMFVSSSGKGVRPSEVVTEAVPEFKEEVEEYGEGEAEAEAEETEEEAEEEGYGYGYSYAEAAEPVAETLV
jgi:DNA-directed RNA polymerase subunit E'/Rpb7